MSKTKIIIIGIIVVILFGSYIVFVKKDKEPADKLTSSVATAKKQPEKQIGAEILSALATLEKLNLDTEFFKDSLFRGLKNFSKPIQAQPTKRDNPFAPIGNVNTTSTSTNTIR